MGGHPPRRAGWPGHPEGLALCLPEPPGLPRSDEPQGVLWTVHQSPTHHVSTRGPACDGVLTQCDRHHVTETTGTACALHPPQLWRRHCNVKGTGWDTGQTWDPALPPAFGRGQTSLVPLAPIFTLSLGDGALCSGHRPMDQAAAAPAQDRVLSSSLLSLVGRRRYRGGGGTRLPL